MSLGGQPSSQVSSDEPGTTGDRDLHTSIIPQLSEHRETIEICNNKL